MRSSTHLAPAALALLVAAGCGRASPPAVTRELGSELPLTVLADSAESGGLPPARLGVDAPGGRLTLLRVAAARAGVQAALPVPEPSVPAEPERSGAESAADDALRPPLPRGEAILRAPGGGPRWLELDVRVDERGEVTDALAAAGDADSATVRAAIDAALRLRWYPATRRGRPVAVWSRQRFEVGGPR